MFHEITKVSKITPNMLDVLTLIKFTHHSIIYSSVRLIYLTSFYYLVFLILLLKVTLYAFNLFSTIDKNRENNLLLIKKMTRHRKHHKPVLFRMVKSTEIFGVSNSLY